ncbi:MAG: hypothetical protein ABI165_00340 [Bryobacteraceae bacterium]
MPVTPGLALRTIAPNISPSAALALAADVSAGIGTHELPYLPKTLANELDLPCCVSCAIGAAMETMSASTTALSPMFHYHVTRFDNLGADTNGFLLLEDGLATATNNGVCRQDLHNVLFTDAGARVTPSPEAVADAVSRVLGRVNLRVRYREFDGPSRAAWVREQIRLNQPVLIAFRLPVPYPNGFLDGDNSWTDPNAFALPGIGHCVLAFGYDDVKRAVHIQDCQGKTRFDQGCWWMGYRVLDSNVVQDAYCLVL